MVFILFRMHSHQYSDHSLRWIYFILCCHNTASSTHCGREMGLRNRVAKWHSNSLREKSMGTLGSKVISWTRVLLGKVCREEWNRQRHRWRIEEAQRHFYNLWEDSCLVGYLSSFDVNKKLLPLCLIQDVLISSEGSHSALVVG